MEQLLRQNFRQLESWQRSGMQAMADEVLRTRHPARSEFCTTTSFGKEVCYLVQFSMYEFDGESQLLVMVIDLSDIKRTAAEMQHLREELYHMDRVVRMGEMAASLAHELNQPLTGILSNAQSAQQLLARDPPDLQELRAIQCDIVQDAKRAGEVIRRLRAFLRRDISKREPVAINPLIHETIRLARMNAEARNVTLETHLADALPDIMGDRIQLQEVLINLISNATQAMPERPHSAPYITLTTAPTTTDSGILVTVQDNGTGFTAEHLAKAFAPYFTTKANGLGMGLRICQSIVEAHSGIIWAENHPEGGAIVRFTLPAMPRTPT